MTLERLAAPPIVEVVCGVSFEPVPALDPLTIGWYALERVEQYPNHQSHPPITDPGVLLVGPTTPVRVWLVSADEVFLLQVQHDRFFLNWRARGSEYPRFNEHDGEPGILQRVLDEFERFSRFCSERLKTPLQVRRTELAKVDHLVAGVHWTGADDLRLLVPALVPVLNLAPEQDSAAAFNLAAKTALGQLHVSATMQKRVLPGGKPIDIVVIESRSTGERSSNVVMRDELAARNDQLNDVFDRLIPRAQRDARFGGGDQ